MQRGKSRRVVIRTFLQETLEGTLYAGVQEVRQNLPVRNWITPFERKCLCTNGISVLLKYSSKQHSLRCLTLPEV